MPKYYVSSGDLNRVIDRSDPKTAAIAVFETIKEAPPDHLGELTLVSEQGFDSTADEDVYFRTLHLLDETGQLEFFANAEWLL